MSTRPIHEIEGKWQAVWEKEGTYRAKTGSEQSKFYGLIEFPFPSGDGLHVGHPRSYTAIDVMTRKQRMLGKNVLYPIGWDAFGLPTENYAIKHKIRPQEASQKNIANFTRQLKSLGFGFDWDREVDTTDPKYYRWTQWQFLKFYGSFYDSLMQKARPIEELEIPKEVFSQGDDAVREFVDGKRLAFRTLTTINWCPKDKIGLANEEAQGGVCERCGTAVEKREKAQWMIRITAYAERLIGDLDTVDYLDKVKAQQVNWIGKSEGAYIDFTIPVSRFAGSTPSSVEEGKHQYIRVFTTRPDTLFGVTYVVLAPEHAFVEQWLKEGKIENVEEVRAYREAAKLRTDMERTAEGKEKTGVALKGIMATNPANGEVVPVWMSDYVLAQYGTGAVMAVPAHDERDFAFAEKFGLPKKWVVDAPVAKYILDSEDHYWAMEKGPAFDDLGVTWDDTLYVPGSCVVPRENEAEFIRRLLTVKPTEYTDSVAHSLGTTNHIGLVRGLRDFKIGDIGGLNAAIDAITNNVSEYRKHVWKLWWAHAEQNRSNLSEEDLNSVKKRMLEEKDSDSDPVRIRKYLAENLKFVCYSGEGFAVNSDFLNELPTWKAKMDMTSWLAEQGKGEKAITYRLRDWVFSRQRYWGEPIPLVHCEKCGWVPVPDSQLPVTLPEVEAYEPSDDGESPLAAIRAWVETSCPDCGGKAERETDTMPNWAGSSWYFLRYCDPKNDKEFASQEAMKYWMPVDLYNGGMEHTTLHLLYSRFWYKFLFDLELIPAECGSEPYAKRRSHGLILAEGGEKMSKSKGNVVNPDEVVSKYGADVFRVYELFMGPFDQPVPWDVNGIEGVRRFLDKVWGLYTSPSNSLLAKRESQNDTETLYHQTLKKITEGIDAMQFNTCVSHLMILVNAYQDLGGIPEGHREGLVQMLAPFAPHLAEELWSTLRQAQGDAGASSVHVSAWPSFDPFKLETATVDVVVQMNGKVRDRVTVDREMPEGEVIELVMKLERVRELLNGAEPKMVKYVKGKLVSIVH